MIIYIWALVQNRGRRFGLRANLYIYPECFSGDFILSNPGRFLSPKKQVPLNIVFCVWSLSKRSLSDTEIAPPPLTLTKWNLFYLWK